MSGKRGEKNAGLMYLADCTIAYDNALDGLHLLIKKNYLSREDWRGDLSKRTRRCYFAMKMGVDGERVWRLI